MIRALVLSIEQLPSRPVLALLAKSLALTLVICVIAGMGLFWGGAVLAERAGWVEATRTVAGIATGIVAIAAGWFLFRALAVPVIGLFGDQIVAAVEARHYPRAHAMAAPVSFGRSLRMGLASVGRLLGYNLVATPLYILLVFTAVGPFLLFTAVNAILLGRDFGEMVAARHGDRDTVRAWLDQSRTGRALLGLIVTGLFLVPGVNLFAPVIGAAMATHLFHSRG